MKIPKELLNRHRAFWSHERAYSLLKMALLFATAMVVQFFATRYVGRVAGLPVGDIFLSNIPTVNIDFFIVQGALIATFIMIGLLIWKPRYIPFTVGAVALFVIIRAFFISLTHLGVDPNSIVLDTQSFGFGLYNALYNSKSDLFFSGHTGMPFLLGLIFLHDQFWGKLFFVISFVFGVSVLLAHVHYSIDVFAAPFITYSIFTIAKTIFPKEYVLTTPAYTYNQSAA